MSSCNYLCGIKNKFSIQNILNWEINQQFSHSTIFVVGLGWVFSSQPNLKTWRWKIQDAVYFSFSLRSGRTEEHFYFDNSLSVYIYLTWGGVMQSWPEIWALGFIIIITASAQCNESSELLAE